MLRVCVFLGLPYISAAQLRLGACAEGHIQSRVHTSKYENVEILRKSPKWPIEAKSSGGGGRVFFMTNDQFFLFPMLSYGYKNTVGVVAHLFFSDPPLRPHAIKEEK